MKKFVRTKSHTGSKVSKQLWACYMHLRDCSCAPILQIFDAALGGATANRQITGTHFWSIFLPV